MSPGTVVARLVVFPVIVKGQREAAKLNNVMPEMTRLSGRMTEAKQSGNKFECKFRSRPHSLCLCFAYADVLAGPLQLPKPTPTSPCSRRSTTSTPSAAS